MQSFATVDYERIFLSTHAIGYVCLDKSYILAAKFHFHLNLDDRIPCFFTPSSPILKATSHYYP